MFQIVTFPLAHIFCHILVQCTSGQIKFVCSLFQVQVDFLKIKILLYFFMTTFSLQKDNFNQFEVNK